MLIITFYVSLEPYQFNHETKRSKLVFRACFCYLWERRSSLSQVKRQSCLKVTLKPIRRISRAWSSRFVLTLTGTIKRKGGIHKGGKEFSFSLPCAGRGSVRAATAGTVAPSHLLLKFGKLTTEFELLFQLRKTESYQPPAAAYGKAVPSRLFHVRSAS